MLRPIFAAGILLLVPLTPAVARETFDNVAKVKVVVDPPTARPGQSVTWKLTLDLAPGWHSYPTKQSADPDSSSVTEFTFPKPDQVVFVGNVAEPPPEVKIRLGKPQDEYEGSPVFQRKLIVSPNAKSGKFPIQVEARIVVCNENNCLPPKTIVTKAEVMVDGQPMELDAATKAELAAAMSASKPPDAPKIDGPAPAPASGGSQTHAASPGTAAAAPAATLDEHRIALEALRNELPQWSSSGGKSARTGLINFLITAAFWGAVALITPCVFPMIPITVSFFLKQSEREHHRPIVTALVYCLTIIFVLGISALTLLTFFRNLSVAPGTNIALGLLFLVFALSLFGMYEITLPSSMARFTSSREGKGGMLGTVFMALTFTVVSFTCVAPFLGGFGGMAASGQFTTVELVLGALVFSTTFAAPFFVLAMFPSLLKKLPKSGSWLNSVKVVMGFLELAAALKFFRTAELRLLPVPAYFTYDLVMGIWVALALLCGLYLLNLYRLPHDDATENIGVVRMLLGLGFLSLAIYLVPAAFKTSSGESQRPGGVVFAWVDSFLLPEPSEHELPWSANLPRTVAEAKVEAQRSGKNQRIFVDFTGVTCTNCKYNERTVFIRGDVRQLFQSYRLAQMYTDEVPGPFYSFAVDRSRRRGEAQANLEFQKDRFGTEQLPLYVLLNAKPNGKVEILDVYLEGKINDVTGFVEFLKRGLSSSN
jgi:thiol:disulfide interchange protein DsbD